MTSLFVAEYEEAVVSHQPVLQSTLNDFLIYPNAFEGSVAFIIIAQFFLLRAHLANPRLYGLTLLSQRADKAQVLLDGADSSTASNSTAYMVEKEWFDNFLAYKDKPAAKVMPGNINNGKLLSSKVMSEGTSSIETMSEKVDTDNNNNLETDERQLRRRRWQGIQERNKEQEEKKGDELLGGNAQYRPELREGVDYVLVGKKTWSFLSSKFLFDVELPHKQQQPQTISLDSIKTTKSGSDSKLSEMDAEDVGSSVAVAPSASSLISEGSSKSESGDDLVSHFPCMRVIHLV